MIQWLLFLAKSLETPLGRRIIIISCGRVGDMVSIRVLGSAQTKTVLTFTSASSCFVRLER